MTAMFSNKQDIKTIKDALVEISHSLLRMDAEKELIKEIKANILEEFKDKLTPKSLNKMAKVYYKDNYNQELTDAEDFSYIYETIVGISMDDDTTSGN